MEIDNIWQKSLSIILERVGSNVFELWFKPIKLLQAKDDSILLEIPNRFFKDWIEDYHPNLISEVVGSLVGRPLEVKYKIAEKQPTEVKKMDARLESRKTKLASRGIYLNPRYTFETFVVGPSNQFAQAAARAVADSPGSAYNPLFIYGGVGLGKTHLITAIGNHVADTRSDYKILYLSAEQFINEVVYAFRNEKAAELKAKYRGLDLLLIDDIQLIENKTATQEELFHTLNTLYERQKQIVISSDRPPKEIKSITDRLRSRFSMGLIADIQPPEVETKIAIIHKKAEMEKLSLPEDVVHFLATKIRSNIRDLEGCLIRLGAYASLSGSKIDLASAKSILRDFILEEEKALTVDSIARTVAEYFGIKPQELRARKRTKDVALPRQVAMYLARELTESSLSEIGKQVGGKDHATVIYACKQVEAKRASDEAFAKMIETLKNKLRP